MGIEIAPEMVEGHQSGYATGELADTATTTIDHQLFGEYAIAVTVGYQEHEPMVQLLRLTNLSLRSIICNQ